VALGLGFVFQGQNISFISALGLSTAASANFPVLLLAIFWRRFTAAGAFAGILSGLCLSLGLIWYSPLIQVAVLHRTSSAFPLHNPGIVAIPIAFAIAILVSLASRPAPASAPG
jgi:cation/acetate symporter